MRLPHATPLAEAFKLARRSLRCLFLEVSPDVAGDVSHNVELAFQALERAALASLEDTRARVQALAHSGKLENPAKERVRQRAIATALAAIEGTKMLLEAELEAARPARVPRLDDAETDPPKITLAVVEGVREVGQKVLRNLSLDALKRAIEARPVDVPLRVQIRLRTDSVKCPACSGLVEVDRPAYVDMLEDDRAHVLLSCPCGNRWRDWIDVVEPPRVDLAPAVCTRCGEAAPAKDGLCLACFERG